jgi:MFS family permease
MTDRRVLYASAFLRALVTGWIGILLGLYLGKLGCDGAQIGLVVAAGLAGAAVAAIVATVGGDRIGRRRLLVALALLGAAGAALAAAASHPGAIAAASFLGMLNGMGRDRGAALVLEQAALPGIVPDSERTRAFAWYNVLQDAGHAVGGLMAAVPSLLAPSLGIGELTSFRVALGVCAVLTLGTAPLYFLLSPSIEAVARAKGPRLSPASRNVLVRICSLFALDGLAGGFLTTALLSFFFYERFGIGAAGIGPLFFGARLLNAGSHIGAAWLAKRIGLVNTMVFTHVPSSLLLATVPFAPNFPVAAILFLLREGLVEMDVPTRQSYVMAMVRPEERSIASGVTHLVRLGSWAVAPSFAGLLMKDVSLAAPLVIGAGMKIAYDVLLYAAFRRKKPPEEVRPP